jgi:hypothetical protein
LNPSFQPPPSGVQISNFKFVESKRKAGHITRSLRFTLVASFGDPARAIGTDGCLATIKKDGELVWSPPRTRLWNGAQISTTWVNDVLYADVIAALASSPYIAGLQSEDWDESTGLPVNQGPINV